MLVLSRRPGEEIVIGEGEKKIIVTLADIRGTKARIGVTAPAEIKVFRSELLEREDFRNGEIV